MQEDLSKLLTLACARVRLDEGHFPVQTSEGLYSVPFGDILCCTLHQHSVRFLLEDGTVRFDDGSVYNRPISLALTDDFKPSVISKDSDGGITVNGKKIGADFAKSTAAFAITAAKEFVSATLKPFMGFGGIINLFIDLFSGGYNQQTDNRLSELMDQVGKISVQMDESTAAIIQNADANQLKNHVTKVSDSASALRRGYYDYYNANAIKALNLINGGVSSAPTARRSRITFRRCTAPIRPITVI